MKRSVNGLLVSLLFAGGIVAAATLFGVHAIQASRTAELFLQEGRRSFDEKDFERAMRSYRSHLKLAPQSTEARQEFGELLYESGSFASALAEFEYLLRIEPDNQAARRKAAECALKIRRFSDANDHIVRLLQSGSSEDAEVLDWKAQCLIDARKFSEAASALRAAIDIAPEQLESFYRLAVLQRDQLDSVDEAVEVLKEMTEKNQGSYKAFRLRGQFAFSQAIAMRASGDFEAARQRIVDSSNLAAKSVELGKENLASRLLLVRCLAALDRFDEAIVQAEKALQIEPQSPSSYLLLSEIATRQKKPELAMNYLEDGIEKVDPSTPGKGELLIRLAGMYLDSNREEDGKAVIERLAALKTDSEMVDFLRGRLSLLNSEWTAAIERMEAVRLAMVNRPDILKAVEYGLGIAYLKTNRFEQAIAAQRRAITLDPAWAGPRLALVNSLELAGQRDAAYKELEDALRIESIPPESWIALAKRSVLQNLQLPREERDWAVSERILERAEAVNPGQPEIAVLRAEVLGARGQKGDAEAVLAASTLDLDSAPDDEKRTIYLARSNLAQRNGNWDLADQILSQAELQLPSDTQIWSARANYLIGRYGESSIPHLRKLLKQSSALPQAGQTELRKVIASVSGRAGYTEFAKEQFLKVAYQDPRNTSIWSLGVGIAIDAKDAELLSDVLDKLKSASGKTALWNYGMAALLELRGTDDSIKRALTYLSVAEKMRPAWKAPFILEANILLDLEDRDGAIASLTRAIDLGERSPEIIRTASTLLYQKGESKRADRLLRLVDARDLASLDGLARAASFVSVGQKDYDRGIEVARAAADGSENYRDHIWLGELASLLGRRMSKSRDTSKRQSLLDEAANAFRRAVELAPKNSQTWISRVRFLVGTGQLESAEAIATDALESLPENTRSLTQAQCLSLLGKSKQAEEQFEVALNQAAQQQNDRFQDALRTAIAFYFQQQLWEAAEKRLEQLLALQNLEQDLRAWARRHTALLAIIKGTPEDLQKGLTQIEENLSSAPDSVRDRRVRATILSKLPGRSDAAVDAWRSIVDEQSGVIADDHFQLAMLLKRRREWDLASEQLRRAIASARDTTESQRYVGEYIAWLMKRGELDSASRWFDRFVELEPGAYAIVRARAELMTRKGNHAESASLIRGAAKSAIGNDSSKPAAASLMTFARLASIIGQIADPEKRGVYQAIEDELLREAVSSDRRFRFARAAAMLRHGKVQQGVDMLAEQPISRSELGMAIPVVDSYLNSTRLTNNHVDSLESLVQGVVSGIGESTLTLGLQASIEKARGNRDRAIQTYRRIISIEPDNVVALNNLAVALSEMDDSLAEAARLADRAVEITNRLPAVLDTRAVIAIAAGDADLGLELLNEAVLDVTQSSPVLVFHLAVAQFKTGNVETAAETFANALARELDSNTLSEREQTWFDNLEQSALSKKRDRAISAL